MRPPATPPSCGAPCLIAETSSPPVRHCSPVEACTRLQFSPSTPRSSVLHRHETHPHSLPPFASAASNKSLTPTANNSAQDDDELTVTADEDRVANSINPPSLRFNCELPSLDVNCDAPTACGWGGETNASRHEVEQKMTPVLFIRISEPKLELDDEAALVGGKRKR
ncbi:hypothetical protein K438DRAFT_1778401 [Mycena galopus ATCC 62051]|nr:hypothetical protein K438DRAFT_1778401 [Mycena galopus ATCC 62051]